MSLQGKIDSAIERLRMAAQMSQRHFDAPPYICISGGKDSSVLQQLAIESGIECIFHHSHTTVDAPITVYFVRSELERLRNLGYKTQIHYPEKSMWQLIEDANGMPPTRMIRYCCKYFKEAPVVPDKKAFIATGVRWAESTKRKSRAEFEVNASKASNALKLKTEDQDLERRMFEDCRLRGEKICNPIIDWTDDEVWEFINDRDLPVNPLYKMGFKRVGCVGCPMSSRKESETYFAMYPQYKAAYIRAMDKGIKRGRALGKEYTWAGGEERFEFWMSR